MRVLDFFARRRARESAIPGSAGGAQPQVGPPAETAPPPSPEAVDPSQATDDQRTPGGSDLRDLAALIKGALEQGNATASVDGRTIDLGEAGLRGGMFEPLGSGNDPEAEPGKD